MLDRKSLLLLAVIGFSAITAQGQICRKEYGDDPDSYAASQVDVAFGWLARNPAVIGAIVETNGHIVTYELFATTANVWGATGLTVVSRANAVAAINSVCGPGFIANVSTGFNPRIRAAVTSVIPQSGMSNESLAIGDFNGDGDTDTAAITVSGIQVSLRGSDGSVAATANYNVSGVGSSIVAGDFNGDGILDLAATQNDSAGNVVVLLGKGNGTFGAASKYPAGQFAFYLALGDFNRDGHLDLAVTNINTTLGSSVTTGTIAILAGNGSGGFAPPVNYNAGSAPATILAADFDGDGILDLAALDAVTGAANNVWVLSGRGDGTFLSAKSTASGTVSGHLAFTDLDHDGKMDLAIADQFTGALTVMRGNGNGTFQAPESYVAGSQPISIAPIPLNDGSTLFFTVDNISGADFIFFADPQGKVHSPLLQSVGRSPASIVAADLNGDKSPDLVVGDSEAGSIYVKLWNGSGFGNTATYQAGARPAALATADLNRDGKSDIVAADGAGIEVLLGNGDGTLGQVKTYPAGGALGSIAVADFNGDGAPDVAAANGAGGVAIFLGTGSGSFQNVQAIPLSSGSTAYSTVTGDFNRDGKQDVIAVSASSATQPGSLAVMLGKGDGAFQTSYIALPGPLIPQGIGNGITAALAAADFNGDGKLDIAVVLRGGGTNSIGVLLGDGEGGFAAPVLTPTTAAPPTMAAADVNGDGFPDLILSDCCGLTETTLLFGKGDGSFQAEFHFPSGPNTKGLAVADFNGDGKPDLAVIGQVKEADKGTLVVWYNQTATGTKSATATIVSAANPNSTAVASGSLAIAYGTDLAQGTLGRRRCRSPTSFGGTSVSLVDASGKQWQTPLIYVSAGQVNFEVPAGVAPGMAQFTIASGDGTISTGSAQIASVAPGLFVLNTSNLVAATAARYGADGSVTQLSVYAVDGSGAVVASPVSLGASTDQVYLTLYGTGLQAAGTTGVTVSIGGVNAPVAYAGPQGSYAGLDQVNVMIPHSLAGAGNVTIRLTANGIAANPVQLTIM